MGQPPRSHKITSRSPRRSTPISTLTEPQAEEDTQIESRCSVSTLDERFDSFVPDVDMPSTQELPAVSDSQETLVPLAQSAGPQTSTRDDDPQSEKVISLFKRGIMACCGQTRRHLLMLEGLSASFPGKLEGNEGFEGVTLQRSDISKCQDLLAVDARDMSELCAMFGDGACGPEMKRVVCRIEADYLDAIYHDLLHTS